MERQRPPQPRNDAPADEPEYDPEDWLPTFRQEHYSNKRNHLERSIVHHPAHIRYAKNAGVIIFPRNINEQTSSDSS